MLALLQQAGYAMAYSNSENAIQRFEATDDEIKYIFELYENQGFKADWLTSKKMEKEGLTAETKLILLKQARDALDLPVSEGEGSDADHTDGESEGEGESESEGEGEGGASP